MTNAGKLDNLADPKVELPALPKGERRDGGITRKQRKEWHAVAQPLALAEAHAGTRIPCPEAFQAEAHPQHAAPMPAVAPMASAYTPLAVPEAATMGATAGGMAGTALCAGEDGSGIPRGRGRPSEFTDQEADAICAWIAGGASLRSYCAMSGRGMDTIYRWMREHAHFRERYAQAHEDRADTLVDESLAIADAAAQAPTIEAVAAAKLRVETRRWIAAKLRPGKWGEVQRIEHRGAVSIRIGIPQKGGSEAVEVVDVAP